MLREAVDEWLDIPFDEPLSPDEAARVAGFLDAAELEAWRAAYLDESKPPPPHPPTWRTRIPAWDITKPNGGIVFLPDGRWAG